MSEEVFKAKQFLVWDGTGTGLPKGMEMDYVLFQKFILAQGRKANWNLVGGGRGQCC